MALPVYVLTLATDIISSSVANPSVITTRTNHGFTTGQTVEVVGHAGSTPSINGSRVVTVTGPKTFTIPLNVTVAGSGGTATRARVVRIETLQIDDPVNETGSCRCAFVSLDAYFRPGLGSEVVITEDATRIFCGIVAKTDERGLGTHGSSAIVTEIEADSAMVLLDRAKLTLTLAADTLKNQLTAFVAALPASFNITLSGSQVNGPAMPAQSFDNQSGLTILQSLIETSDGYAARLDHSKVLSMFDPASTAAPSDITAANGKAIQEVSVTRTRRNFANKVTVLGGHQVLGGTNMIGEVHTATAAQTKFLLAARMHYFGPVLLYITRSGVTTIEYVDGTVWTYDDTDYSINKGTAAAMGAGDTLAIGDGSSFGYWAKYPMAISATDPSYATDPNEVILERPDMFNRDAMQALADAELAKRLPEEARVTLKTAEIGDWYSGQSLTLTFPTREISGSHTITNLRIWNVKGNLVWRQLTAVSGSIARRERSRQIYDDWLGERPSGSGTAVPGGTGVLTIIGPAGPVHAIQFRGQNNNFAGNAFVGVSDDETSILIGTGHTVEGDYHLVVGEGHTVN